jgi:hypothetical protein
MEDNLQKKMQDDLKKKWKTTFKENGKRPQKEMKMLDDLNFFENQKRP